MSVSPTLNTQLTVLNTDGQVLEQQPQPWMINGTTYFSSTCSTLTLKLTQDALLMSVWAFITSILRYLCQADVI